MVSFTIQQFDATRVAVFKTHVIIHELAIPTKQPEQQWNDRSDKPKDILMMLIIHFLYMYQTTKLATGL